MIGLFFGGNVFKTKFGSDYGNIELDANMEEVHEWTNEVTTNPVEEGAPVADHVIQNADKLRIRGFVSDAPMDSAFSRRGLTRIAGIFNGMSQITKVQPFFDTLRFMMQEKELLTVYTKHHVYKDMVLQSVNIPRTAANGEAIEFVCEFINIRKVQSQTVDVPNGISKKKTGKNGASVQKKAATTDKVGQKQAEEVKKTTSMSYRVGKAALEVIGIK